MITMKMTDYVLLFKLVTRKLCCLKAAILALAASLALSSCVGSHNYQTVDAANTNVPRYLELQEPVRAATLHFPSGQYVLEATDSHGSYYRAPQKIYEHSFGGTVGHEGGIYVRGKGRVTLRGYIYWHGALTHIGNFSRANYNLHD